MLELAARYGDGEPVRVRDVASAHNIPARFLVQLLLQLKAAGLVTSTRGAAGGYQLAQPPEQITLAAVMSVIEGPAEAPDLQAAPSPMTNSLTATWREVADAQQEMLDNVTFADLLRRAGSAAEMYYI